MLSRKGDGAPDRVPVDQQEAGRRHQRHQGEGQRLAEHGAIPLAHRAGQREDQHTRCRPGPDDRRGPQRVGQDHREEGPAQDGHDQLHDREPELGTGQFEQQGCERRLDVRPHAPPEQRSFRLSGVVEVVRERSHLGLAERPYAQCGADRTKPHQGSVECAVGDWPWRRHEGILDGDPAAPLVMVLS
jgi:hypothetical protein